MLVYCAKCETVHEKDGCMGGPVSGTRTKQRCAVCGETRSWKIRRISSPTPNNPTPHRYLEDCPRCGGSSEV
jgi:hypothetical protein